VLIFELLYFPYSVFVHKKKRAVAKKKKKKKGRNKKTLIVVIFKCFSFGGIFDSIGR